MTDKKLEFKDIAGYLPYGLKCKYYLDGWFHGDFDGWTINDFMDKNSYEEHDFRLILRPISDLYKTIIHNEKEIVPIVEMAKIAFPHFQIGKVNMYNEVTCNEYIEGYKQPDITFGFDGENFYAFYEKEINVSNQYQLFDYIHELKIDYRGLIDAGLAIDVNTLEINPYK
jgi:hypothetical protein